MMIYFEQASINGSLQGIACIALYLLIRSMVWRKSLVGRTGVFKIEFVVGVASNDFAKSEISHSCCILLISRRLSLEFG